MKNIMKRFLISLLAVAMVFSLVSCGESDKNKIDPNAIYDSIDETVEIDGQYKIHSIKGLQQLAKHPEAKFILLCDIDCEGEEIVPAGTEDAPFTGSLNGQNHTIKNFVIKKSADDGNCGIFGYFKGLIKDTFFTDIKITSDKNTKNIGTIAGVNAGSITRTTLSGEITVDEASADGVNAGGVCGINKTNIDTVDITAPVTVNADVKVNAGGIAGVSEGGSMTSTFQNSSVIVANAQNTTLGLYAGDAKNTKMTVCGFIGAECSKGGEIVQDYNGKDTGCTLERCLKRDVLPKLPDNVQKLRDKVVDAMYKMGTIEWTVPKDLHHDCTCQLTICHGIYYAGTTYYGIPYNHKGADLARMQYILGDDNMIDDWAYDTESFDGFDTYVGSDCSSSVQTAWFTVSNTVNLRRTSGEWPGYTADDPMGAPGYGCLAVGDWDYTTYNPYAQSDAKKKLTTTLLQYNSAETMCEAYACMRKGDAYVYQIEAGGHTRMIAEDPIVVRDMEGKIEPTYSYLICHEQGAPIDQIYGPNTYTSWKINYRYTFASLLSLGCFPVTCEELLTGEMEPAEASMIDGVDGKMGLFNGTVKANYNISSVVLKITDADGNIIMNETMFPGVGHTHDTSQGGGGNDNKIRCYNDELDMGVFATPLQKIGFENGATYNYSVTANLSTGDSIVVKENSFVQGQE